MARKGENGIKHNAIKRQQNQQHMATQFFAINLWQQFVLEFFLSNSILEQKRASGMKIKLIPTFLNDTWLTHHS